MNTLIKDIVIKIVLFLDGYSKISLHLVSSYYDFIPAYIYTLCDTHIIPNNTNIKMFPNLRILDLSFGISVLCPKRIKNETPNETPNKAPNQTPNETPKNRWRNLKSKFSRKKPKNEEILPERDWH